MDETKKRNSTALILEKVPANIENIPMFFIIGRPRSGTTLLRMYFDAHPNVQIPVECSFIFQLYSKYKKIKQWEPRHIHSFVRDLTRTRFFQITRFDTKKIENALLAYNGKMTYQTACKITISCYDSLFPKEELKIVGDKNPLYASIFNLVFPIFPEARYIHLIRDPRDAYLSSLKAGFGYPLITLSVISWRRSYLSLKKFKEAYPDRFLTVRFEDLISNPEETLKRACEFLEIPFTPLMLDYIKYKSEFSLIFPQKTLNNTHQSIQQNVDPLKANQWKQKLTPELAAIADRIAGDSLTNLGYERSPGRVRGMFFKSIPAKLLLLLHDLFIFFSTLMSFELQQRFIRNYSRLQKFIKILFFHFPRSKKVLHNKDK